jgi:hypothetical protein
MRFPSWVTFVDENLLDVLPHGLGVCLNDALLRQAAGRHFDQDEVRRQVDRSVWGPVPPFNPYRSLLDRRARTLIAK